MSDKSHGKGGPGRRTGYTNNSNSISNPPLPMSSKPGMRKVDDGKDKLVYYSSNMKVCAPLIFHELEVNFRDFLFLTTRVGSSQ